MKEETTVIEVIIGVGTIKVGSFATFNYGFPFINLNVAD